MSELELGFYVTRVTGSAIWVASGQLGSLVSLSDSGSAYRRLFRDATR